ncbi:MAG TPA: TIGR03435 family protein [Acidobacteriaceae bacterium]
MKKIWLLWMIALAQAAGAQTLVGVWQGTLPIENPRMMLRFANRPDGTVRGALVRIDRDAEGIPISSITFHAPDVKIDINLTGFVVSFQGRMADDGKSMMGTWTQDKQTYPLTLVHAEGSAIWTHDHHGESAMPSNADPSFEVATIKPSVPGQTQRSLRLRVHHFAAKNATVEGLLEFAYDVRDRQVDGGPAWIKEARFDIEAEPDIPGIPTVEQDKIMLKKLLAERFHLTLHTVQRTFPVYAMTLGKDPPKVVPSEPAFGSESKIVVNQTEDGATRAQFLCHSMKEFTNLLMNFITDRQVVDETGLKGIYDFTLSVPASALGGPSTGDTLSPADALYHATESQLGFKLVRKNAQLDVLVIDRLEMPTEN